MNKLNLKDLKKGQTFYQFERGRNIKMVALENARQVERGMAYGTACKVEMEFGSSRDKLELFELDKAPLNIFSEPQK